MAKFSVIRTEDVPGRKAPDFRAWLDQTYALECALASKNIPVVKVRNAPRNEYTSYRWREVQQGERVDGRKRQMLMNDGRHVVLETERTGSGKIRDCSSGYCYWGRHISLVLGTDEEDRKLVALHELAHWLRPRRESHSAKFWTLAFDLFEKYNLDMPYAAKRSADYKAQARKEAQSRGIPIGYRN